MFNLHGFLSGTFAIGLLLSQRCDTTKPARDLDHEHRLIHDLFTKTGYNPLIRPVHNDSERLIVNFSIDLLQIIDLNAKRQVMKVNIWVNMQWTDFQLQWDPTEYGGIEAVRIDFPLIWTPDVVLFNNVDGKYEATFKSQIVMYNSYNLWVPPAIYQSACELDVSYFPFDQQVCELKFGSWTFNSHELGLNWIDNVPYAGLKDYVKSQVWDILNCSSIIENVTLDGLPREQITYQIVLRRKFKFYLVNLIVPCLLIAVLSITVFFLPAGSCEKITLAISLLFALVVFLLLISQILPPSDSVPLLAKYLLFCFISNIISTVVTVLIINIHMRSPNTHHMSPLLKTIFLNLLPRVIFMQRPENKERYQAAVARSKRRHAQRDEDATEADRPLLSHTYEVSGFRCRATALGSNRSAGPEYRAGARSVATIAQHYKQDDERAQSKDDWIFMAAVIDRVMLFVFFTATLGATMSTFIDAPNLLEVIDQDNIINQIKLLKGG